MNRETAVELAAAFDALCELGSMKKSEVTERMKQIMSHQDHAAIFGVSQVPHPPRQKRDVLSKGEKQDHIDVENFCNLHDLFFVHSRMDKPTRNAKGVPDFVIGIAGRLIALELKIPGKGLTPEQDEQRRKCEGPSGCEYHLCYSSKQAIEILMHLMHLLK